MDAMRKLSRIAAYGFIALVWVVALFAALELYQGLEWRKIERENRFVLARRGVVPWPGAEDEPVVRYGEGALSGAAMAKPEGAPSEGSLLPPPDPMAENAWRAEYFLSLDQFDRPIFASVYGLRVVLLDADGNVDEFYPGLPGLGTSPALAQAVEEAPAALIREALPQVLNSGAPLFRSLPSGAAGQTSAEIFLMPIPTSDAAPERVLGFVRLPKPEDPASLWEQDYALYKKHARRTDMVFRINNYGFRDKDVEVPKPPGRYRILCVGSSTTEEGDTNDATYPHLLGHRLAEEFGEERIEVINCGISGMNSLKQKMRLPDYLALDPDLIIYYDGANDIVYDLFRRWVETAPRWQRLLGHSRFIARRLNGLVTPPQRSREADLDAVTLKNLRFIQDYLRRHEVGMVVCSFAYPDPSVLTREERGYFDYYNELEWGGRYVSFATYCEMVQLFNQKLRSLAQETGIPYVPVAEGIRGGTNYFGDLCHMKNAGIKLKAQIIAESLKEYLRERLAGR